MTRPSTTTPSDRPSRHSTTTTPKPASEIWVAKLPDAFGYGITGYGRTAKEAEAVCRKCYFANDHGPGTGWHAQPWKDKAEGGELRVFKVKLPSASLDGREGE